jgi:8-oxo-dGTP pyrophosphatase MutT (NUDIX family)
MSLRPWPLVRDEELLRYKVFAVHKTHRRSPRTGQDHGFFGIRTLDWVNVVALTDADEIVLVQQYRPGPDALTLEIPGGCVDPGEDFAAAARRELREETGYVAREFIRLARVNPNPALFHNTIETWLALGCSRAGDVQPDPGEDLAVVVLPMAQAQARAARGEINHALALSGLYLYRLWLDGRSGAPA